LLNACFSGYSSPEVELWGEWVSEKDQVDESDFAVSLIFHEDGRLVLDGQEDSPAQYVVIAPGRIKITRDGEAEVINYEVMERDLRFSYEGIDQFFKRANEPVIIGQAEGGLDLSGKVNLDTKKAKNKVVLHP
jgi:hypothetical protein